jgi:hypothetical protein
MLPKTNLTPELLRSELERLEQTYRMSSYDFYARFHEGTLSEEPDFMRWAWLCTVAMRQGLLTFRPAYA